MSILYNIFMNELKAGKYKNEEELKIHFLNLFRDITGKTISQLERKTTSGRTDAIYKKTIIEFKAPKVLKNITKEISAKKQVSDYKTLDYDQLFVFDGYKILDVMRGQEHSVNEQSLELFVELIKDEGRSESFTPFGIEENLSPFYNKELLSKIYSAAKTKYSDPELDEWKDLFAVATNKGGDSYLMSIKNDDVKSIFGDDADFNIALFTLHTYFSIIVKNILVKNLYDQKILKVGIKPSSNAVLEKGAFWRKNDIFNMFESDIFSWYIKGEADLNKSVTLFRNQKLDSFEPLSLSYLNKDFFNIVYEIVIPHSIRKSLGEYYTPPFAAKELMEFGNVNFEKRIMDPTCGSGTFLIQVIDKKIKLSIEKNGEVDVDEILSSIVGIDINPVALLAAKANVLLRLIKFRKNNSPIFLPIYSGDSTKMNDPFYKKIWEKHNIQPALFSENEVNCVAAQYLKFDNNKKGEKSALEALRRSFPELSRVMFDVTAHERSMNEDNKIKFEFNQEVFINLIGEVEYIVGNPPWVKWSNLPEGFRAILKQRGFDTLFSKYKNSGGNSLDLYAPIIKASAVNYLSSDGVIAMIMPMSLNYNSSLETVRAFEFLENGQKISKIMDFASNTMVFKDVAINFGYYIIDSSETLEYVKVVKTKNQLIKSRKFPIRNDKTFTLIPFESEKQYKKIEPLMGMRDEKYKVRSGVQFTPNKLRQFYIESEEKGIVTLVSSRLMKEQKQGIENIVLQAERESIAQIIRTKDLRGNSKKHFSWWAYNPGEKKPMDIKEIKDKFPVLHNSLMKVAPLLDKSKMSKFNERISKAPWWGNIRVGEYTQAPYRVCFPDNGEFTPKLITDIKLIPEGHVRFIPLYDKKDAERIFNILNKPEVKELMRLQYLNLNKSFLPQYMNIKF